MDEQLDKFFAGVPQIPLRDDLVPSATISREQQLARGSDGVSQPSNVYGRGRLMPTDPVQPLSPRLYDGETEFQFYDTVFITPPETEGIRPHLLMGIIDAVNPGTFRYDVHTKETNPIYLTDQRPVNRCLADIHFGDAKIPLVMAEPGDLCTILVYPNGGARLWEVEEFWGAGEACPGGRAAAAESNPAANAENAMPC